MGGLFDLPWLGGGDLIGANFVYSKGAVGYATKAGSWQIAHDDNIGVGWVVDGIYDNTGISLRRRPNSNRVDQRLERQRGL